MAEEIRVPFPLPREAARLVWAGAVTPYDDTLLQKLGERSRLPNARFSAAMAPARWAQTKRPWLRRD